MKVLVISHNVFDNTDNMGKTLSAYFGAFKPEEMQQFYFHNDTPCSADVCKSYFRFTDKDAVRSLFSKKDLGTETCLLENSSGSRFVQMASIARNGIFLSFRYIIRNTIWKYAKWNTQFFRCWVDSFKPDCIFFAGGDYTFAYKIALDVKKYLNVPLIVCTTDDYYIQNICQGALFSKAVHKQLQKTMKEVIQHADAIVTVSDSMSKKYEELFKRPSYTFYNSTVDFGDCFNEKCNKISYLGNLRLGRAKQLVEIGKALKILNIVGGPDGIDVYSSETDKKILDKMNMGNGIRFHGAVSGEEVNRILKDSMTVIHTESFNENTKKSVQYSLSTKIAESLLNAQCLFAYGPSDIASMDYLIKNNAAICVTEKKDLISALKLLIEDADTRKIVHDNARKIALVHHNIAVEPFEIRKILTSLLEGKHETFAD